LRIGRTSDEHDHGDESVHRHGNVA
jgi:hypothetical protein